MATLSEMRGSKKIGPPAMVDALLKAIKPAQTLYKDATQTVSNSTTLQVETKLGIPVESGKRYIYTFLLPVSVAAIANNIKFDLAGGTCSVHNITGRASFEDDATAITQSIAITALNTSLGGGTLQFWTHVKIQGSMRVNQGGSFRLQFAQVAAAANNSSVLEGATLTLTEV